jgi:hypothetical protein
MEENMKEDATIREERTIEAQLSALQRVASNLLNLQSQQQAATRGQWDREISFLERLARFVGPILSLVCKPIPLATPGCYLNEDGVYVGGPAGYARYYLNTMGQWVRVKPIYNRSEVDHLETKNAIHHGLNLEEVLTHLLHALEAVSLDELAQKTKTAQVRSAYVQGLMSQLLITLTVDCQQPE